jgi:hypothetical protein
MGITVGTDNHFCCDKNKGFIPKNETFLIIAGE